MADTLKLEIVTPGATVYSEDVHMVTLPAVEGQIGIFPHHVPLLTRIVPGEIMVRKDRHDDFLAVGEGLVEITGAGVPSSRTWPLPPRTLTKPGRKKRASAPRPRCATRYPMRKARP